MRLKYFLRGLGAGILFTTIILTIAHNASDKMSDADIIARAKELGMVQDTLFPVTEKDTEDDKNNSTEDNKDNSIGDENSSTEADKDVAGSESTQEAGNNEDVSSSISDNNVDNTSDIGSGENSEGASDSVAEGTGNEGSEITTEETMSSSDEEKENQPDDEAVTGESLADKEKETSSEENITETTMAETTTNQQNDTQTDNNIVGIVEPNGTITFEIDVFKGMTSYKVADILQKAGIVNDSHEFDKFLMDNGYANHINIGVFKLNSSMTYEEIAKILTNK